MRHTRYHGMLKATYTFSAITILFTKYTSKARGKITRWRLWTMVKKGQR